MGLFDRLFGGSTPEHPPIDPGSPVAARLAPYSQQLARLAGEVRDALEAVPEENALFVFVGHPPKGFGVVRFDAEGEANLIQVMREAKLGPGRVQEVSDLARSAYVANQEAPRFVHQVGKRAVTVIDSVPLGARLEAVFREARG